MASGKIDLDLLLDASQFSKELDRAEGIFKGGIGGFMRAADRRGTLRESMSGMRWGERREVMRNVRARGGFNSGLGASWGKFWGQNVSMMGMMGGAARMAGGTAGWIGRRSLQAGFGIAGGMAGAATTLARRDGDAFRSARWGAGGIQKANKVANFVAQAGSELKKFGGFLNKTTKSLQKFGKGLIGKGVRTAGRAASFIGGSLMGFMTGAFREGISNYQTLGKAQIEAAPYIGARGRVAAGAGMGFNAAEMAGMQAQANRTGMGGAYGGTMAGILTRAVGREGIEFGGGIMRRQGLKGKAGGQDALRQLSRVFQMAVKTGLDASRVTEFMAEANKLSEQQISITPDMKGFQADIAGEMARLQQFGGPGLKGRYAGQALAKVHGAIQGATGVQQQFAMRAFGFGRGASLMEVLKRQEQGATGANVSALMKQLQSEYGAGEGGGLSDAAKLAFKGMGFGSIGMAEKFSSAYLERKEGKITQKEFDEKIKKIKDAEKEGSMPSIQRRAYANINRFGAVVTAFAGRFDKMAGKGAGYFKNILKPLWKIQSGMVDLVDPIFKKIGELTKKLPGIIDKITPMISSGIDKVFNAITYIGKLLSGFMSGAMKASHGASGISGLFTILKGGFAGAGAAVKGGKLEQMKKQAKVAAQGLDEYRKQKLRTYVDEDTGMPYKETNGGRVDLNKLNSILNENFGKPIVIEDATKRGITAHRKKVAKKKKKEANTVKG